MRAGGSRLTRLIVSCSGARSAAPWKLTLVPVYDLHTGFPYSVENEFREYVGPRNVARFPRFSSFDLQVTRPISLHFGEKHLHARVGMGIFNLFNHFDPRDVQNNLASARFGGFFNTRLARIPRQICLGVLK